MDEVSLLGAHKAELDGVPPLRIAMVRNMGWRRKDCMQSWRHIDTRLVIHDIVNPLWPRSTERLTSDRTLKFYRSEQKPDGSSYWRPTLVSL